MFALMVKEEKFALFICANYSKHFVCILPFDIFNITMMWQGKCSHLMKYFCVVMFHVASPDRPDPAQFQKINFVGSLMTGAIATARGKHTKSETSHLKTRSEQ